MAAQAAIEPAAMRKRLQRIRQKLRKEIEMDEQRILETHPVPRDLPGSIVELLARPRLVDLPDNPVGAVLAELLAAFPGFLVKEIPEVVDLDAAGAALGGDAVYIDRAKRHAIDGAKILRYDLTLPLLLEARTLRRSQTGSDRQPFAAAHETGLPLRLTTAGKCYRREEESATHLEAFHQLEVFAADDRRNLDVWWLAGRIIDVVDRVIPRSEIRIMPTDYPMCAQAFSLDVRREDEWVEVLAFGEYADWVLCGIGADPSNAPWARGWASSDLPSSATASTTCARWRRPGWRRSPDRPGERRPLGQRVSRPPCRAPFSRWTLLWTSNCLHVTTIVCQQGKFVPTSSWPSAASVC
jgi:hypothetical protein